MKVMSNYCQIQKLTHSVALPDILSNDSANWLLIYSIAAVVLDIGSNFQKCVSIDAKSHALSV